MQLKAYLLSVDAFLHTSWLDERRNWPDTAPLTAIQPPAICMCSGAGTRAKTIEKHMALGPNYHNYKNLYIAIQRAGIVPGQASTGHIVALLYLGYLCYMIFYPAIDQNYSAHCYM